MNKDNSKKQGLSSPIAYDETFINYETVDKKKDEEEKPEITSKIVEPTGHSNSFKYLTVVNNEYESDSDDETDETKKENEPKMNGVTQFFVGSLSVVGLFILFKFLYKKK
jgi:hypothetical protein